MILHTKSAWICGLLIFMMGTILFVPGIAVTPPASIKLAHRFTEEAWAIEYDVLSNKLVEDYTPGEYSEDILNDTAPDYAPYMDANYYIAYINLGQVQTLYLGFSNYTWDRENTTKSGVAPYQLLQQYFRTSSGKHVIVQNTFAGLVAFQDSGIHNGVPDGADALFYGYSLNSNFHRHLLNRRLWWVAGHQFVFDESVLPVATPQILQKSTDGDTIEYTFGMNYENLFVLWHSIDVDQRLNESITADAILQKIVAISVLDSLNFTYTVRGTLVEDRPVNITTTTEYNIGPVSDLWVLNDDPTDTAAMGGIFYPILSIDGSISRYNTTETIIDRLNGNDEAPGFSLAIANYARVIVIATTESDQQSATITTDTGDTVDPSQASDNVSSLDVVTDGKPAFKIDFASKPTYTLDDGEPMAAPVKLYPTLKLVDGTINSIDALTMRFIHGFTKAAIQARLERIKSRFDLSNKNLTVDITRRGVFYAVCFPTWEGKRINQDPTFIALAVPEKASLLSRIDGFSVPVFILAGLGISIFLIIKKSKLCKQNHLVM